MQTESPRDSKFMQCNKYAPARTVDFFWIDWYNPAFIGRLHSPSAAGNTHEARNPSKYAEVDVVCNCGNAFKTRFHIVKPSINVEVCSGLPSVLPPAAYR